MELVLQAEKITVAIMMHMKDTKEMVRSTLVSLTWSLESYKKYISTISIYNPRRLCSKNVNKFDAIKWFYNH